MKRSFCFILTIVAYAVVMLAVTLLRAMQARTDNTSRAEALAVGVVMCATTVGGAWLAEAIMSRRVPSLRLRKEWHNVRRRIREVKRRQDAAKRYVARFSQNRASVILKRGKVRAAYTAAYQRATALKERRS